MPLSLPLSLAILHLLKRTFETSAGLIICKVPQIVKPSASSFDHGLLVINDVSPALMRQFDLAVFDQPLQALQDGL